MNPLQEHPNIFCNDQFKIKNEDGNSIVGYDFETGMFLSIPKRQPQGAEFYDYNKPENCTLIARKIDDMTDEEIAYDLSDERYGLGEEDFSSGVINAYRESIKDDWTSMNGETLLYLLSIGVYPFDQSHFGETEININEI